MKLTKTYLALAVLTSSLAFSPVTFAGSIDGKGLYCPGALTGYWFQDGKVFILFIKGYEVYSYNEKPPYKEKGTNWITWLFEGRNTLDRSSLTVNGYNCHIARSEDEVRGQLDAIIKTAKKKNKI